MVNNKRKTKLNNSGMSLVEIIIAVTILGIVVIPVLHSLTSAMVYNSKARIRQEMTLKAESIMENFKGYSLKELNEKFTPVDPADPKSAPGLTGLTDVGYYPAGTTGFLDTTPAEGTEFVFKITDLKDSKGKEYNVEIKATANKPEQVVRMKNMDTATDAVFSEGPDRTYETAAKSDVVQDFKDNRLDAFFSTYLSGKVNERGEELKKEDVSENAGSYIKLTQRKLKFDIKEDSGNYVVELLIGYHYCIEGYPYYEPKTITNPPDAYDPTAPASTETVPDGDEQYTARVSYDDYTKLSGYKVYERPVADGLKRLFVYYYPQYELSTQNDVIEINNTAGISDFDCYLIKQRAKDINLANTINKESLYTPKVEAGANSGNCNIYHNFLVNIGNNSKITAGDSGVPASPTFKSKQSLRGAPEAIDPSALPDFIETEVISYDLQLTVMAKDSGAVVTTLSSSKLD